MRSSKLPFAIVLSLTAFIAPAATPPSKSHGIDVAGMDKSVKPGDDFFAYANGTWTKTTEIPPDRSTYGVFTIVGEQADKRTADLIQEADKAKAPAGSEVRMIGDYYAAFMDEKAIEARGLKSIQPELDEIAAIHDKPSLAHVLGSELRADVDALNNTNFHTDRLFGLWVSPDFDNPNQNVAYLLQGGLGMPDRENYRSKDSRDATLQTKYHQHIVTVLTLAHISDATSRAAHIYDLERKIAEAHATRVDSEDVHKANNRWALSAFPAKAPGLDWADYFKGAGLSDQPAVMVWQPSAVTGIAALAGSEPLAVWKDYLAFHAIDRASGLLPKAFADENFKFYGTTLFGAPQQRARWKRAVSATGGALGDAVGKLYVKHYFPPASKAAAQTMVKNIVAAFRRRIDNLSWMSPDTRTKAKAKLSTLYIGIGYPEHWRNFSGLRITRDDALGNRDRSELFDYRASVAKLGKPVDKSSWAMEPQTVNAVNLPLQNALNFPAAILNPPFFDANAEAVLNYGAIGTVIGHEISHSFDDQGSQFDADGRLLNWWTKDDFAHFSAAADRLAAEFDKYEPLPGLHVNGKQTLSENLADVAGLSASFDGYRSAYGNKPAPTSSGFAGDQRFFLAFAQVWRSKRRPEALRNLLMTDGHAPSEYRADTARNIDEWYAAFDVKAGQKLYLAPKERVRAW